MPNSIHFKQNSNDPCKLPSVKQTAFCFFSPMLIQQFD